jgi:hypothetical protein
MRTPSKYFPEREVLLEEHSPREAGENRCEKRQHRRVGQRQVLQGEIHPGNAKEPRKGTRSIRKTARILLERFAPSETLEHQQGSNTLWTK